MAGGKQGHHSKRNTKSPKLLHNIKREAEKNVIKGKPSTCKYDDMKTLFKEK